MKGRREIDEILSTEGESQGEKKGVTVGSLWDGGFRVDRKKKIR